MRRLLIIAWVMLRDEQSYRPAARSARGAARNEQFVVAE
jgi:hypothetical protein